VLYLAGSLALLIYLAPALLAARSELGFPAVSHVAGVPVAWHGIYFFTGLALALGVLVAFLRGAGGFRSLLLAGAGLAAFEFLYGVVFASSTGRWELFLPRAGLPATGWAGFATWLLVEFLVASFALVGWERAGVDRSVLLVGLVFALGLLAWGLGLGWRYPPYDNAPVVFLVNSLTEVSGSLLLPLMFTTRSLGGAEFAHRIWRGTFGRARPAPATGRPRNRTSPSSIQSRRTEAEDAGPEPARV
jgi:hypothetical protein